MGVLDDAIREHLELKRQRGASETDVLRAEQDALGPARRDLVEPGAAPDTPADFEPPDAAAPTEHAPTHGAHGDPFTDEAAPEALAPHTEAFSPEQAEPAAHGEALEQEPAADESHFDPPEAIEEDRVFSDQTAVMPVAEPGPDADPGAVSSEESYDDREPVTEGAPEADHEDVPVEEEPYDEEAEDVLEDTPEFLQETPEHDRLWFEQKPPREFDFDD